jgi:LysR family hydrogen peroxide-inducible transcriptional activator
MRPTIPQLETLVAVARTRHFRHAAEELHATQPALSAQVRKLETILGVQLFERDRRHVILTRAGQQAAEAAARLLAALDDLVALAKGSGDPLHGSLRLGVIPTIAPHLLPRACPALRQACPRLQLLVREDTTQALLRQLREGWLDLLLLAIDVPLGQVETLALFDDEFVLALPRGHALAARKSVRLSDLKGEPILLLEDGHCLAQQTQELCRKAGPFTAGDFRATSLPTLVQMVAAGLGVTLIPELAVGDFQKLKDLELRPFAPPAPRRRIGLAWRTSSARGDAFRAIGQVIEASQGEVPRT